VAMMTLMIRVPAVLNKTYLAPSNDTHDYLSWAAYYWPDCSNVDNTTALTPQQEWSECIYVNRDGQFAPDVRLVNNSGDFQAMSDAIFYNAMAYKLGGNETFAQRVASYVDVWFINNATAMNPNLNYVIRGVDSSGKGQHTGVLDLHDMTKVVSAILLLRVMASPSWTQQLDSGMNDWCTQYVEWLMTSPIALEEKAAANNHGSFYASQTSSTQATPSRASTRTRSSPMAISHSSPFVPVHSTIGRTMPPQSSYVYIYVPALPFVSRDLGNDALRQTINRIAEYMGIDTWNITTAAGTTVHDAVNYAMAQAPGDDNPLELSPVLAAAAMHYGDPKDAYASWIAKQDDVYPGEEYFFWEQPLSNSGLKVFINWNLELRAGDPPPGSGTNINGSNGSRYPGAAWRVRKASRLLLGLVLGGVGATALIQFSPV
jgi:hypothetical protein